MARKDAALGTERLGRGGVAVAASAAAVLALLATAGFAATRLGPEPSAKLKLLAAPPSAAWKVPMPGARATEATSVAACSANMRLIAGRFCIDAYEASTADLDADDRPLGPHSPYEMNKRDRVRAESRPGVHPQAHVTLLQAKAACELAGKRLCSDAEWLRACKGAEGHDFPYGPDHERDRCNERASSPLYKLFGSEPPAAVLKSPVALNNPRINQLGGLAKTGAFAGCKTKEGVYDLVGNLHEWTSDPRGTFRGGYYRDAREHGLGCNYVTKGHDARYRDYSTGFRCCAEPTRTGEATHVEPSHGSESR